MSESEEEQPVEKEEAKVEGETKSQENGEWSEVKGGDIITLEKEGDSVEGELIDVRTEQGKFKSTVYELRTEEGKDVALFGSTVLDGKMKKVEKGSQVKITFLGKQKSKDGQQYKDYRVETKN